MTVNSALIRKYLMSTYSDEEINALCFDNFADVSNNFTTGMSKQAKIQLLLDYCRRRGVITDLSSVLKKDRSDQYLKYFEHGPVGKSIQPTQHQSDPKDSTGSVAVETEEWGAPSLLSTRYTPAVPVLGLLTITSPIRMDLVRIRAGEFVMGTDSTKNELARPDERPQHPVCLPEFYLGKYPVTNSQYAAFLRATKRKAPTYWKQGRIPGGKDNHPVVHVSWHDAAAFCCWLSEETAQPFRLPTEAEWEKVARGADGRTYPWGNEKPDETRCNFNFNMNGTTPVERFLKGSTPDFNVLDLAGNVWEWVADWYDVNYYEHLHIDSPQGPDSGRYRVLRGGSWASYPGLIRASARHFDLPSSSADDIGFRCACSC